MFRRLRLGGEIVYASREANLIDNRCPLVYALAQFS